MDVGVALPQFDYGRPGAGPVPAETLVGTARAAEAAGFGSVWLADHLFMEITKYGGPPGRHPGNDPLVLLGALAAATRRVAVGTLVLCAPLRPALVVGKALATIDRLSDGRLVAGVGAGWLEGELDVAGVPFERPGRRLEHLASTVDAWRRLWAGAPGSPPCVPGPAQPGGPPVWIGGRGDRLLGVVAHVADGWNTVWRLDRTEHRARVDVLARACETLGRDPATVALSVGLATLVGEDEADVARRFEVLASSVPGVVTEPLGTWRRGRLVGTVEQVREEVAAWAEHGLANLTLSFGALPFSLVAQDDLELAAAATVGAS